MGRLIAMAATTCLGALLAPNADAMQTFEPWPSSTGVQLGEAWNSRTGEKLLATCIEFESAEVAGQHRSVNFGEASDRSSLMRTFSVSTKAKAKSILGGSASASASFSRQTKVDQQNLTFAIDARIHDSIVFVVPKGRSRAIVAAFEEQSASRALDGESFGEGEVQPGAILVASTQQSVDDAFSAFVAEGAPADGVQKQLNVVALANEGIPQVRLTREAARLLRSDPVRFRATCGDSFVGTIRKGAGLQGIYAIRTVSREERQEVKGKVGGSFATFSGSASSKATLQRLQNESRVNIDYIQLGGSGTPIASNHDSFIALIGALGSTTSPQTSAPFEIGIIPYTDLPGVPSAGTAADPLALLADQYLRLESLDHQMNDMLAANTYWFDSRVTRDQLKRTQDETKGEMARIRTAIEVCDSGTAACKLPGGVPMDDYHVRMRLPVQKTQVRYDQNIQNVRAELDAAQRALANTQSRICWRSIAASPFSSIAEMGPGDGPGGPDRPTRECHTNPRHSELTTAVARLKQRLAHLEANRDSTLDRFLIWVEQPAVARCENRELDLCRTNAQLDSIRDEMLAL